MLLLKSCSISCKNDIDTLSIITNAHLKVKKRKDKQAQNFHPLVLFFLGN
jgi:hypothetical protein